VSIIDGALSIVGDALAPYAYIGGNKRSIGTIIPDIVVSETHHDHLTITKHPVETGAAISDHCFMEPPTVEMQCGCSNSTAQSEGYVQQVYAEILALQSQRQPFNVSTGKRQYSNMLIGDIIVTTDESSEYALNFTVALENVKIVSTQTTGASASNANQASPATTASPTNSGSQSLTPTNGAPSSTQALDSSVLGPSTDATSSFGGNIPQSGSFTGGAPNVSTGGITPTTMGSGTTTFFEGTGAGSYDTYANMP
jgi:hypothetical protein